MRNLYPQVKVSDRLSNLYQDPLIDGIVVATPAESHYQVVKEALLAGKDIFVEKPLALKVEEGGELLDLAREKKRVLMAGHLLEHHPGILNLKQMVSDGELGKINYIHWKKC